MQVTLLRQGTIHHMTLPEKIGGRFWIQYQNEDQKIEDVFCVDGIEDQWIIKSSRKAKILNEQRDRIDHAELQVNKMIEVELLASDERGLVYIEPISQDRSMFKHYMLPTNGEIKIGRLSVDQGCDISYQSNYVSSRHAKIRVKDDKASIVDLKSTNGTYVNEKRANEQDLNIGDVIEVFGLKIIVGNGFVSINNPDQAVELNLNTLNPKHINAFNMESTEGIREEDVIEDEFFYRSPRFKREIQEYPFKIDAPPAYQEHQKTPLILRIGPSLTMGTTSLLMGLMSVQNAMNNGGNITSAYPTLIMSGSMLTGAILWPILNLRFEKKKHAEKEALRQEKYLAYLDEKKEELSQVIEDQKTILEENNVDVDTCIERVFKSDRSLWERSIDHNDFLRTRVGKADLLALVDMRAPERHFSLTDDNLQDAIFELSESPLVMESVPCTVDFRENFVSGITGDRRSTVDFVKKLIIQMSTLHSYDELKICLIYDENDNEDWESVKWIPHVWLEDNGIRLIGKNKSDVKEVLNVLEKEYNHRLEHIKDHNEAIVKPYYLILALNKQMVEKSPLFTKINETKANLGFSIVNVFNELNALPKECSTILHIEGENSSIFDPNDLNGNVVQFRDEESDISKLNDFAVKMANIKMDLEDNSNALPSMLTFLEMFGVTKLEHLNIRNRWKTNNPVRSLEAPIGVLPSGDLFKLDLHEEYHGPHGLVAGMTGSGKSEFIMTYIMSLAVNYHPDEVAFILIDYKGGGMANAFKNLPHLAGTITNLDGAAVNRSLVSIQSELKRRQAIFGRAGEKLETSNIDIYKYQKLYRDGLVDEPLQHLFIISDEFAELKSQQPEFMQQLISTARIGRSLGVHLILATQKPAGVVDDQIWSNSKFRVCLKVQERADSMDVIKRPDASELKNAGRFYVQVGYNELFEIGQSAWAGAPYDPDQADGPKKRKILSVIDAVGRSIRAGKIEKKRTSNKALKKQIDEVNTYLHDIAAEENIKVRQIWLEAMAEDISLNSLKDKYSMSDPVHLSPIIGEVDDPENQRRMPLRLPMSQEGNMILYSAQGNGEEQFVNTMLLSMIEDKSSEELNLYVLDFNTEALCALRDLPHVGEVVVSSEVEKVEALFKMLNEDLENRKSLFTKYGGDWLTYSKTTGNKIAHKVVLIHNYSIFSDEYEHLENELQFLTREGKKYGIYFVLTAFSTNAIRSKLEQNFKQILSLQLNDSQDYSMILGRTEGLIPSKCSGRGLVSIENKVFEFQTANATGEDTLYAYVSNLNIEGVKAPGIKVMPEKLDVISLEEYKKSQVAESKGGTSIGVAKNSLDVVEYEFNSKCVNMILSSYEEYMDFGMSLIEMMDRNMCSTQVFDLQGLEIEDGDRIKVHRTSAEIQEAALSIYQTILRRNNDYKDALETGKELPEFDEMYIVMNNLKSIVDVLTDDLKDKLNVCMEHNSIEYKVHFILLDQSSGIREFNFENWFSKHCDKESGIWVGNGFSDQHLIKSKNYDPQHSAEIDDDYGYVVNRGKAVFAKLMSS